MKGIEFLISLKEKMAKPLENINKKLEKTKALAVRLKNFVIAPRVSSESLGMLDRMNSSLFSLKNLALSAVAGAGLMALSGNVTEALAQTEKFQVVLTKTLGDKNIAAGTLQALNDFGDKTNYLSEELINSYTKLANRGLRPTQENLTAIGDVANVLQKPFGDLNEAILDISNSERWKELGIKSEVAGDKVKLTFRGMTQTVDQTEKGVLQAITAFGQMNGILGVTEEISQTTGGKLSTLEDNLARVYTTIGKELQPEINYLIDTMAEMIAAIKEAVLWISANRDIIKDLSLVVGIAVAAWGAYQLVVNAAAIAQAALNLAMSLNPIGIVIVALAALAAAFVIAWNKSETFRGAIMGLWEAAKTVFGNIGNFFVKTFDPIFKAIDEFKKGNYLNAGKAVAELAFNLSPVGLIKNFAEEVGKGVGESFDKGFGKGAQEVRDAEKNRQGKAAQKGLLSTEGESTFTPTDKTKAKKNKGEARVNAVTGEARNQRNITINIGTLKGAEKIEVTASTIGDFMNQSKFEKMLTEALLRSVRNAETSF